MIVRATQFFEFVPGIADVATDGKTVRLPPVLIQPMPAAEVSKAVAEAALANPVNGMREVGGPEALRLDDFVRRGLTARRDPRQVVADPQARYYGIRVEERTLLPGPNARLSPVRFDDWLRQTAPQTRAA